MGRLLPDTGIRRDLRQARPLPVGAHLQVGQLQPLEQADAAGWSPGTSAGSTRPGKTGGCSATARAAPTCTASPGPTSSDTRSSDTERHPMIPRLPITGPARRRKTTLPINKTSLWLLKAQDGRCPICRTALLADDRPQTPREWESGWPPPATRSPRSSSGTSTPDDPEPRLIHVRCGDRSGLALLPAYEPRGLLEPDARKRARPVLRGAERRKALGLPDQPGRDSRARSGACSVYESDSAGPLADQRESDDRQAPVGRTFGSGVIPRSFQSRTPRLSAQRLDGRTKRRVPRLAN